ncbi:hypothetical protein MKX01_034669 [Papaver californicum]|nr:hypothetical protein MKX01_034669 [Papaver californicum]
MGKHHHKHATDHWQGSFGGNVYMVCRNKEQRETDISKLCNLSCISHIKSWASKFISRIQPLHILFNFSVNVTGTFSLTKLLVPLLEKATPDARVITVSSDGMYTAPLNEDLQFSKRNFDVDVQYARSKRVQVPLTERWEKAYNEKGFEFFLMHPGWEMTPGVVKGLPELCKM